MAFLCFLVGHRRDPDGLCARCGEDVRETWEIEMDTQDRIERLELELLERARRKRLAWKLKPSTKHWSPR